MVKAIGQGRHLQPARPAPRGPEVEDDDAPLEALDADRLPLAIDHVERRHGDRRVAPVDRQRADGHAPAQARNDGEATGEDLDHDRCTVVSQEKKGAVTFWGGGHFEAGQAPLMERLNASIGFDKRLWRQDLVGSAAHARMLAATGIVGAADARGDPGGPGADRRRDRGGRLRVSGRPRGHSFQRRGPADRADRRAGPTAAHRPLAQRPGGDSTFGCSCATPSTAPTGCCAICRRCSSTVPTPRRRR